MLYACEVQQLVLEKLCFSTARKNFYIMDCSTKSRYLKKIPGMKAKLTHMRPVIPFSTLQKKVHLSMPSHKKSHRSSV